MDTLPSLDIGEADLLPWWLGDADRATPVPAPPADPSGPARGPGRVLAVWGPTGAPGRTTVAIGVADEAARLGVSTLLADADPYGGTVAQTLGLRIETAGLALACRDAAAGLLDPPRLAQRSQQLRPRLRVLTGIDRADRWPELRPAGLRDVLEQARHLCSLTVVDCGFCLERDTERGDGHPAALERNGATLAALDAADTVLCVGAADAVGVHRLVRALDELREVQPGVVPRVVINRLPDPVLSGAPPRGIAAALKCWGDLEASAWLPAAPAVLDSALRTRATLADAAPGSALRRAVAELTCQLLGASAPTPRRRRRLLGRR